MPPYQNKLALKTQRTTEAIDITSEVTQMIKESGIIRGTALIYTPHTTTAITINESESGLLEDLSSQMLKLVPKGKGYKHDRIDHNAHAHIMASIIGPSVSVPVVNGELALGTWQSVLFIELDGPRSRNVLVQVF